MQSNIAVFSLVSQLNQIKPSKFLSALDSPSKWRVYHDGVLTRIPTHVLMDGVLQKAMTLKLKVPDMACSACADTITKAVKTVDPQAQVEAEPKTKVVLVETTAPATAIKEALAAAGYPVA